MEHFQQHLLLRVRLPQLVVSTMPIAPDAETPVNVTVMVWQASTVPNAAVAASPVKVTVTPVPSVTVTLLSVEDNCGDVTFTEASA